MKQLLTCMVGLVAFTAVVTSGCAVFLAVALSSNPDDATLRQGITCSSGRTGSSKPTESLQVLGTHKWSQGVVVLYTALCPGQNRRSPLRRVLGYKLVKRHGINWQISGSDSYGVESAKSSEELVSYGVSKSPSERDRYTILYGQILKPKVTAVEATFDNGQVLRHPSNNGVFALIAPNATAICELRVLGTDNQILQQKDLAIPIQFAKNKRAHQCLPTSQQL